MATPPEAHGIGPPRPAPAPAVARRPKALWWALAALLLAAGGVLTYALLNRERAYERCHRIAYDAILEQYRTLAENMGWSDEETSAMSESNATIACDYLQDRGRLDEIDERNALDLIHEARD